ncbi:MAG: hypothetical protein KC917_17990 [Candidatus Omnitrophica bacterium]|nr:hypothetical protein [Candidatus Omnitrophota bacterium]MCA9418169.1 hypothetical protein [Candidatus Omnitrophota bacterium]MCA9428693.1 hypothetical protein [Candidatus Omnitrophota bacterium]
MTHEAETVSKSPKWIPGVLVGIMFMSVVGMLVGSFAGGGPNPQAFAVLVAISVIIGLIVWIGRGAPAIGGVAPLIASLVGAFLAVTVVVICGVTMGFASSLIPVYFLIGGLGGAAGVGVYHRLMG